MLPKSQVVKRHISLEPTVVPNVGAGLKNVFKAFVMVEAV